MSTEPNPNPGHSTGPRTAEGKARSSLNATRHGLTGQVHVTTPEEAAAHEKHCKEFFDDWKPEGATEKHLVQTIADKQWLVHQGAALLRSIQAVGQSELEDAIDTDHPEVHTALTAGLVAIDKGKQLAGVYCRGPE